MILYNVTLNVDESVLEDWLKWMKEEHLPEVMSKGKFSSYAMYKIFNHQSEDKTHNYSVQYMADSLELYESYVKNDAPALKLKTIQKYGDKVLSFRTILEKVL